MTAHYRHVRAWLDPEPSDPLAGDGRLSDVCVVLSDRPGAHAREPAAIALLASQARELAFELLELAEQADRHRKPVGS